MRSMAAPASESADSGSASARHQRGLELLRGNQAALAIVELEQAVRLEPANAEYLNHLGSARKATGDLEGAMTSYRRALELAPEHKPARYNLGLVLLDLGRLDEAEAHFRRIHEADPRDAGVRFQLALLLGARAQFAESVQMFRSALELTPDDPYLWYHLGIAYRDLPGQVAASIECLGKSIALKPDFSDAHLLLGDILQEAGRLDEAMEHYRSAIRLAPDNARAHGNLGDALLRQHRLAEAMEAYSRAIQLAPDLVYAHFNLGAVYGLTGAHDQAMRCYEAVLRLRPGDASARGLLLFEMQRVCDWSRFEELCALQLQSVRGQPEMEIHPFGLLSIPSTPAQQLECARNYAAIRERAVARDRERLRFRFERQAKSRLRIGYLSADFRDHPGAHLIAELIELHDRARFEITAYSYGPDDRSPIRARLSRAFDRFVDVAPLPHADAAARIHGDGVDILLDLTGYTAYSRTEILALRPAPIQVNFLGYPGTMGADFVDYIVTDRFITPPGHMKYFSEAPVTMPGSYQVNDRKRGVADTPARRELGLPDGAFVFCCFNQTAKILPLVFSTWVRLLKAIPDSVLWLIDSSPWATQNLRREALKLGIGPERLIFSRKCPLDQFLARLRAADLFLDTFPYNAHTTASDALWVGLPVLTCAGDTFASRVAGSLLTAIGLPELITHSMDEYEELALRLARRPQELTALREKLSRNRSTAPLFDTPAYARNLEAAFLKMWEIHLAGARPSALQL